MVLEIVKDSISPVDSSYLHGLNNEQLEAVKHTEGPVLVLAGAGTGKTRVLTTRIAHIIKSYKASPGQVLAVTFTNKAAREMAERIGNIVNTQGLWLGTFHSIAAKILRYHGEKIGLNSNYLILDTSDQLKLVKTVMANLNIDDKKYNPKSILATIQRWKDLGLPPERVSAADTISHFTSIAFSVYKHYQPRLLALGAADFGDLLLYNIKLFEQHPDLLAEYQKRFRYILIDEYQDTNITQYIWVRMLAQFHKNICCVGDEDQSIYGWRGAEVNNILRFDKDFPGAQIIRLERNYRSTNHILSAAAHIIAHNKLRLGKTLWTEQQGEKVTVITAWDEREEARYVAYEIARLKQQYGFNLSKAAILVRASFQTRAFEECFVNCAIPYRVIGGLRFYERAEIRDALAYIRITTNHHDDLALERIINTPKRAIGPTTMRQISQYAHDQRLSLFDAIKAMLASGELKQRTKATLQNFIEQIEQWRELFQQRHHMSVVETILKESGYLAMWQEDENIEAAGRLENIEELLKSLHDFTNITEFLEHVGLVNDNQEGNYDDMVNIMTLHAAKGLEFDVVFLPGWEEGIFPHQRSLEENGDNALEEERRLAYVGMTRAKELLYILCANYRRVYNTYQENPPSCFIGELPEDHIETKRVLL